MFFSQVLLPTSFSNQTTVYINFRQGIGGQQRAPQWESRPAVGEIGTRNFQDLINSTVAGCISARLLQTVTTNWSADFGSHLESTSLWNNDQMQMDKKVEKIDKKSCM